MKAYRIVSDAGLPDALQKVDLPDPAPGHGEVLIRVRACSLNYRDLMIAKGGYPRNKKCPVVPLSDGAGEVAAVGEGVAGFAVGDRVAGTFMRDWAAGPLTERAAASSLGGGVDGMLRQRVALPASAVVKTPAHLSFEQAATLPCAAVTAWHALQAAGTTAGQTVLLLGTGGVSTFGLQLAKARGATAILTSSSDAKLERAKALGADVTINYREHEEWHKPVRAATAGEGVDNVLEVGGNGTLERSIKSTRVGGTVSLIGLLSEGQPSILPVLLNGQTVRGIYVGSTAMFEAMNRAIAAHKIEPVIDRAFEFDEAAEAYDYFSKQRHIGKVVIRVD